MLDADALQEAKAVLMLDLFRELKSLFEKSGREVYGYDEDYIMQYYVSRKQWLPTISIEIKKLGHDLTTILADDLTSRSFRHHVLKMKR